MTTKKKTPNKKGCVDTRRDHCLMKCCPTCGQAGDKVGTKKGTVRR